MTPQEIQSQIRYCNNLYGLLNLTAIVDGDILELGVHKGQNSLIMGSWITRVLSMVDYKKKYIGFDTFSGYMPEDIDHAISEANREGLLSNQEAGRWNVDPREVLEEIEEANLGKVCDIVIGDIKEQVPRFLKEKGKDYSISMLYIDCNAYLPAITALNSCKPHFSDGALLVTDEHRIGGETAALKEFVEEDGRSLEIIDTNWVFPHGPKYYVRWKK